MEENFIFLGNRHYALEELLSSSLKPLRLFAVKNSYLEKYFISKSINYEILPSKSELVEILQNTDFDYLVANGIPMILPASKIIGSSNKKLINIHPSYLPDMRGADPVPGALLNGRDSGATTHYMDDNIDTGEIIAQELIPYTNDLDRGLLHQLTFMAEREVMKKTVERNFKPLKQQENQGDEIYYTLRKEDLQLNFQESYNKVIYRIKAFNLGSQGAYFLYNNEKIRVFDAELIENEFVKKQFAHREDGEIVLNYENVLLIKLDNNFVKLKQIDTDINHISSGTNVRKW